MENKDWFEKNIWSIADLMDNNGNLLDYEQFCTKHSFNPPVLDFIRLHNALPREFVSYEKYNDLSKISATIALAVNPGNSNSGQEVQKPFY